MSFFLENDNYGSTSGIRSLTESIEMDVNDMNEAIYNADIAYKDTLIESMQREAGVMLEGLGDKAKEIGNTVAKWFKKMWETFKNLINKLVVYVRTTFNKLVGVAGRLERYVKKNEKNMKPSAKVKELKYTEKDKRVLVNAGFTVITFAVNSAINALKDKSTVESVKKEEFEQLKIGGKLEKEIDVKLASVQNIAKNAVKMTTALRKSQEMALRELKAGEKAAKEGLQTARKEKADSEVIKAKKEQVTLSHKRSTKANKAISMGVKLCNAMILDAYRVARKLVGGKKVAATTDEKTGATTFEPGK